MGERRVNRRRKTYMAAGVVRPGGVSPCLVRNLDRGGAMLSFPDEAAIESEFELSVAKLGQTLRARVVWRRRSELGVAFVGEEARFAPIAAAVMAAPTRQAAEAGLFEQRLVQIAGGP